MEDIFKNFAPKSVTYTPRSDAGVVSILGSVQMSRGVTTFKNMYVVEDEVTGCYILQCSGELPKESLWVGKERSVSGDFKCEQVDESVAFMLEAAIKAYKEEDFMDNLNPYSYIYGYVFRGCGVRLHELWSFWVF